MDGGPLRGGWTAWLGLLTVCALLAAACSEDSEPAGLSAGTTATTASPTSTSEPAYAPSPTPVAQAWLDMDGLFSPSILQAPTVGLDPFAIKGDPTAMFGEVDLEQLEGDVRRLSVPRGLDDVEGLAAAAEIVEDGFRDAGYKVTRFPGEAQSSETPTPALMVRIPGTDCPDRSVLVLAPYDAPDGSPGARAASATAALIEVARLLAERPHAMTVTLLAVPFGAEDPASSSIDLIEYGLELDPVAVLALEGLGVASPTAEPGNLVGLPPAYLLFVADDGSQYPARVASLATARFMPDFWALTAVADTRVFPEFGDRLAQHWWDEDVPALVVTDAGARADDRVGTAEDRAEIVDVDFLADGVRAVLTVLSALSTIDADGDATPDVCQRDF